MKIVILNDTPCGPYFSRRGLAACLTAAGHDVGFWNPQAKSAFDLFEEQEPDIFLGTTYGLDRAIYKNIRSRPHMKVALQCSSWGPLIDDIDRKEYPILFAEQKEIDTIKCLKDETGKPDFIFLHYHPKWIEPCLGHWRTTGVEIRSIANAADTFVYWNGEIKPELYCEASILGGNWGYKSKTIEPFIYPLLRENLNLKIFGNQGWHGLPNFLGMLEEEESKNLFVSSKVNLNIHEKHSQTYGFDYNERAFKCVLAGGFILNDYVKAGLDFFPESKELFCITPEEYKDKLFHFIKHPEERAKHIQYQRDIVLKEHTYFHRSRDLLQFFGLEKEAATCYNVYQDFLKKQGNSYE